MEDVEERLEAYRQECEDGGTGMQQPLKQIDSVVQVETFALPNGKQISFLMTAKGPSCFRQQPDSLWEPIGDDNMALTIAVNRFLNVRY